MSFTTEDFFSLLSEEIRLIADAPNLTVYKPHAKQEIFHKSKAQGRLYIGGNRSGKSVGGVIEGIWYAQGIHPFKETPDPPIRGRVVCTDFLNGLNKIILPIYRQWTPKRFLKGGSWEKSYNNYTKVLTFENGSTIEFMSYEQDLDKFAGTSRHFIHLDEEPPKSVFTECKARLVDTAGDYWITMTPLEGMDWTYDLLYLPSIEGKDKEIDVIEVDMTENPYLSEKAINIFLSGLNSDEIEARKKGKFVRIGGLVYKKFNYDVHVIKPFKPPLDWEWYASVDHGYNNPTAWLWHAVSPEGVIYTFNEHYLSEHTIDYHATTVHQRNALLGRVPDVYIGDPAIAQRQGVTGTSIHTEYALRDIPIALANNDVATGVAKVQQYIDHDVTVGRKPMWFVTEDCPNLIKEIQRLRWKTWANRKSEEQNNKHDIIHKKDDHACDSLRYFFTLMPDLSPSEMVTPKTIIRNDSFLHPSTPAQATDWQIATGASPNNRWDVINIDETLGGIW